MDKKVLIAWVAAASMTMSANAESNNTSPETINTALPKVEVVKKSVCSKTRLALEMQKCGLEMPNEQEAQEFVSANPHYNELLSDIETQSAQALELIKRWELPKGFISSVIAMQPIETKEDLSQLINDGALLENKDFIELTWLQELSRENLVQVITALFDTSDFDTWRTNPNTGELLSVESENNPESKKQLAGYKKEREKSGARYVKMFDVTNSKSKINKNEKAEKVLWAELDTAIALFNEGREQVVIPSRETYARLLNASFGIAFIEWRGQVRNKWEKNINLVDAFSNYLILTGQTDAWNKVSYWDLKHNIASFGSDTNLSERYSDEFDKISQNFLVAINKEGTQELEQYALVRERIQSEVSLQQSEVSLQNSEVSLQNSEEKLAQTNQELQDKFDFMVTNIISWIQAYESTSNEVLLGDVYKSIEVLYATKTVIKWDFAHDVFNKSIEKIQPYLSKLPKDKASYIAAL